MKTTKKRDFFSWTNEEVRLLLQVTLEHKVATEEGNIQWDLYQMKYMDIPQLYWEQYPSAEEAMARDFPHKKEEISKAQIITKLNSMRHSFRKAVRGGRKSGQEGPVVELFWEQCEGIWGGAPAPPQQPSAGDRLLDAHRGLKRKEPRDPVAQEGPDNKRCCSSPEDMDREFRQSLDQWSASVDLLNSNIQTFVKNVLEEKQKWRKNLEQSALKKKPQIVLRRLPPFQVNGYCQSDGSEQPVEDHSCSALEEAAQHEEEEEEEGGWASSATEDLKGESVETEMENTATPSPASTPAETHNDDHVRSTSSPTADLCNSLGLVIKVIRTGLLGDLVGEHHIKKEEEETLLYTQEESIEAMNCTVGDRQAEPQSELVECVTETTDASTTGQEVVEIKEETEVCPASHSSTLSPEPVEGGSPDRPAGSDLDTMDLEQLQREKLKMELRVLRLQEEYYTLKIKERSSHS